MNQFIEECRREWRQLRVPRSIADDMAAELQSDLAEADADGVAPEVVVGCDARAFARTWAAERGAARVRGRGAFVFATVALFVAIAITGAAFVFFASPSQSVQTALPRALVAPPSSAPSPETVTAVWVAAPDLAVQPSDDGARTAGIVLLLVGVGGSAAVTLFSLWRTRAAL